MAHKIFDDLVECALIEIFGFDRLKLKPETSSLIQTLSVCGYKRRAGCLMQFSWKRHGICAAAKKIHPHSAT